MHIITIISKQLTLEEKPILYGNTQVSLNDVTIFSSAFRRNISMQYMLKNHTCRILQFWRETTFQKTYLNQKFYLMNKMKYVSNDNHIKNAVHLIK